MDRVGFEVVADTKPALGPLMKVENAMKRLQSNAFNLKLNARNFVEPLGRITGQVNEFEKSFQAASARVLTFTASAGLFFQITRAIRETVRATVDVEKSLADINVILNKDTQTLKKFGNELFKIASGTGQSFGVVAEAATELARQGLGIVETQKRVKDALILTRLSGMSAKDSVESLTAALNTFKDAGLSSAQVINKLANVDAAFAVSSGDLAEAIKRSGSTAQDAKVSFDELLGIVTSLKQTTGQTAGVVGNSIKAILTRTQRSSTLSDLEKIGVVTKDLAGNTLPTLKILGDLAVKIQNVSDVEQNRIKSTVAGVFQIDRLSALLRDLARDNNLVAQATKVASDATDQATKRNEELNKTLAAQANRLGVNLKKVGAGAGEAIFGPALSTFLPKINKLLEVEKGGNALVDAGVNMGEALLKGIGKVLAGPGLAFGALVFKNIAADFFKFTSGAIGQLAQMSEREQSRLNLEKNISNVLLSQPEILSRIAKGQTTIAAEAQKYTQQLIAQAEIQSAIAATAPKVAGAVISQAGRRNITRKGGFLGGAGGVPQMFNSLGGAINNEIRAGVPRSSIRINSSSALATRSNPAGLAVTNLKDEPMGLKSLGIPNFANPSRFPMGQSEIDKLDIFRKTFVPPFDLPADKMKQFEKILQKISQTGQFATDKLKSFEREITNNEKSISLFRNEINKASSEYRNLRVENIGKISPTGALVNKPVPSGMEMVLASQISSMREENTRGIQKKIRENLDNKYNRRGSLLTGERTYTGGLITSPNRLLPQYAESLGGKEYSWKKFKRRFPSYMMENTPTFRGASQNAGKFIKNIPKNFTSGKAMGLGFAGSLAASSIAPDSPITSGINSALTAGIMASLVGLGPLGIGLTAAAAGAAVLAKEFGVLDDYMKDYRDIISSYDKNAPAIEITKSLETAFTTKKIQTGTKTIKRNYGYDSDLGRDLVMDKEVPIFKKVTSLTNKDHLKSALSQLFNFKDMEQADKAMSGIRGIQNFLAKGGSVEDPLFQRKLARISGITGNAITGIQSLSPEKRKQLFTTITTGAGGDPFSPATLDSPFLNVAKEKRGELIDKLKQKEQERLDLAGQENDLLGFRISKIREINDIILKQSKKSIRRGERSRRTEVSNQMDSFFLFGNDLLEFQKQANVGKIKTDRIAAEKNAELSHLSARKKAINSAAQSLGKGSLERTQAILQNLNDSGGFATGNMILDAESESDKETLRKLNETLVSLVHEEINEKIKAGVIEKQKIKTEEKILQLKQFEFNNELQQARERAAFLSKRNYGDAKGQFARGSIGGAALAGAAQSSLDANIAARGFQRSDYGAGFDIAIRRNFQRNQYDVFQSTIRAVDDLSVALKDGLTTAIADTVLQAKSAREAFSGLANALSRIALERGLDMFMTAALSKINFGGVQKFATGGLVNGGSSANKDTVPAMLTGGEFVLRRSAVNRVGVNNLNAINSGGFAGLQSGGYANINLNNSTDFLGNPRRPTGMSFNIDPSLSAFALSSSMNRQNQIRDQKAKQYLSYRRNQLAALAAYKKQVRGRRYGALIGAASAFGGAAIGSMGGNGYGGIDPGGEMDLNSGGGIPSMLTGGEFVINSQSASRMGSANLGRLNSGGASLGAGSSIGSQENGTDRVVDAIKELKSIFDNKSSSSSFKPSQVNQNSSGPISVTVPVSINLTSVGAETAPRTDMENSNATEEADDRQMMAKQMGEMIRGNVLQELEKQQRPGGMLYKMQSR